MDFCIEENLVCICVANRTEDCMIVNEDPDLLSTVLQCEVSEHVGGKGRPADVDPLCCVCRNGSVLAMWNNVALGHPLFVTEIQS